MRRSAFTLLELMVVLGIAVLLMAVFVPYAMSWREASRRLVCQDNLQMLGRAMAAYALGPGRVQTENRVEQLYPRVRFDAENPGHYTAYTGADDPNPFADNSAVEPNDVTASIWLLARLSLIDDTRLFVCPSSGDTRDPLTDARGNRTLADRRGNFRLPENLSYAYAMPFSGSPAFKLTDTLPAEFAVMADKPPGPSRLTEIPPHDADPWTLSRLNSANHNHAGQNVLFADGSVRWEISAYVGVRPDRSAGPGDNIFTALLPEPAVGPIPTPHLPGVRGKNVGPAWVHDSFLVPDDEQR